MTGDGNVCVEGWRKSISQILLFKVADRHDTKSSNDILRFFLYGSAAINTTEDLQTSLSASQQFAALFRVLPFQPKKQEQWKRSGRDHFP